MRETGRGRKTGRSDGCCAYKVLGIDYLAMSSPKAAILLVRANHQLLLLHMLQSSE